MLVEGSSQHKVLISHQSNLDLKGARELKRRLLSLGTVLKFLSIKAPPSFVLGDNLVFLDARLVNRLTIQALIVVQVFLGLSRTTCRGWLIVGPGILAPEELGLLSTFGPGLALG